MDDHVAPLPVPARVVSRYRAIVRGVWRSIGDDNLTIIAAGLAFYGMLAIFPGLTALVAIYGLVLDPNDLREQTERIAVILPDEAHSLVFGQLTSLVETDSVGLGLGVFVGLALLLWSTSTGIQSLIRGVNIAYNKTETRSFLRLRMLAFVLTIGALLFIAVAIALIAILPKVLIWLGLVDVGGKLISAMRWPVLATGMMVSLSVLYRVGPNRQRPQWRWVSAGGVIAVTIWLFGSALFSWYAEHFGSFNQTYGALGAVIVLLLWLYLSAFSILIGAEVNAEVEGLAHTDSS